MAEMTNIEIRDFQTVSGVGESDYVVLSLSGGSSAKMAVGMFTDSVSSGAKPSIKDGMWWIGSVNTEVAAEGKTPEFRRGDMGIEYKYTTEEESAWRLLVGLDEIRFRYEDLTEEQRGELVLKYSDLTEDEIADLQKPARDMIDELTQTNAQIQEAESSRQTVFDSLIGEMETAVSNAQDTADHPTYVGNDNYVYQWNKDAKVYNKTSVYVRGEAFSIRKVYDSVSSMNADRNTDFREGDFCLINTGDVENPENAQIFVRNADGGWEFLVDMSGAVGFTGKTPQMMIGTVAVGDGKDSAEVTVTYAGEDTDGNPKYNINFTVPCLSYDDLTENQISELQRPAAEMIRLLQETNDSVAAAERIREQKEDIRSASETARAEAERERIDAEITRGSAESGRIAGEEQRVSAESLRKADYESLRENAVAATQSANDAALQARNLPIIRNGTWWLYDVGRNDYVDSGYAVSSDYQLTREKIESVFTGNVETHWHDRYVEKVEGKGLSSEDFTTLLKEKLDTLENYDDAAITGAVETLRNSLDTLVSGDTTDAIESFNEIVAFLEGVDDTGSLSGILASIQSEIAGKADSSSVPTRVGQLENDASYVTAAELSGALSGKQDVISDLEGIRQGAALGATALQEHQDLSSYARTEDVNEWLLAKQDVIDDLESIRQGAALGDTALQEHQDISHLADKDDIITRTDGDGTKYLADDGTYKGMDALPEGGTVGQVLTKTEAGAEWTDVSPGAGFVAQTDEPEDTSLLWVDTDDTTDETDGIIGVDAYMSDTSVNPVQNAVVKQYIDSRIVAVTEAQYEALGDSVNSDGVLYLITE